MKKNKKKKPSPQLAQSLWLTLQERLLAAKQHLARVEEMMLRHQVRWVHVPSVTVKEHTRRSHWRSYCPPLRAKPAPSSR